MADGSYRGRGLPLSSPRARLADPGERGRKRSAPLRRAPPLRQLLEWATRLGYGARGFVYLSVGAIALLSAMDRVRDAVGSRGAAAWLAEQPFGRVWLILLALGLWAFVVWRLPQSVFDADREGTRLKALASRAGQALSGLFPARYRGGAFVGQHGSWNRSRRTGYRVVFVPFTGGVPSGPPEDILTGFLNEREQAMGRPVGVQFDGAGALLVADDVGNVIWRASPAT